MRDYRETLDRAKPMSHARIARRERYAWPGGHLLILITSDGGTLCPDCVRENWHEISNAARCKDKRSGWHPAGLDSAESIEETTPCDHCGRDLECL